MTWTIYHHSRCSKSRETLALLEQLGIKADIVEYQKNPPSIATLKTLRQQLGVEVRDMFRQKEALFSELGLRKPTLTDDQLFAALHQHPALLERPIVSNGQRAVFGRPPENVRTLL
ncbi:arsenate reductase (glutaredoxin) [Permianibacter aggregans]|uniref:Arsenate reductase n=1 Tax=Permianibacter aggregans TaxID=1510150 RepID=A0A4R6UL13_9GAMM|nr:arsenate reductase (glutaredoxin) [Permianibacter aggregans]QGX41212.1 arsenate reductase (glutaredoxin) [Permianibacter aggregans]TDQ45815.1 arsenate reductase [Permianibacter aggregans]